MDRIAGIFLDSNEDNQFTSIYPLQPFINDCLDITYDDPRRWIYTTIGDMVKDTRALGYLYGPPLSPYAYVLESAVEQGISVVRRLIPMHSVCL
jgi:hypothetical protein